MQIIKTIKDMQSLSRKLRSERKLIGFVATMGALHEGHLSLVKRSVDESDITVAGIFVNPKQFGPKEDFKQYPEDMEGDLKKLSAMKADAVFIPDEKEMYPHGFSTNIDMNKTGEILCGMSRPAHFNGVATVIAKLFNIVMPDRAYFGQKDFQQIIVIKKLARELNFDIDIIVCPTIREPDGLAMSSRNSYLNKEERKAALVLYRALKHGEALIGKDIHDLSHVKKEMEARIKSEPLAKIEYIEVVDPQSLEKIKTVKTPLAICIAVKIGKTRLIDNLIIH
ncbi:MAG: pantoate--beta-alanine ligase [Candidatus Mariimomonas ferrooxydans]